MPVLVGIRNSTNDVFFVKWEKCRKNRVKINKSGCTKNALRQAQRTNDMAFFSNRYKKNGSKITPQAAKQNSIMKKNFLFRASLHDGLMSVFGIATAGVVKFVSHNFAIYHA